MKKILYLFLCLPFLLWGQDQEQPRFGAGIVGGLSASQIDGDLSAGYNKLGFVAGLRGVTRLKRRTEASIEFLFAQRGAQSTLIKDQIDPFRFSLTLNYVEIPVQWHYKDWFVDDDEGGFWRASFNAGLSFARFIGSKTGNDGSAVYVVVPDYLKKNDISLLIGANLFLTRHWGFTFRYVRSIGFMYDYRDWGSTAPYDRNWNGHCLYFQSVFMF